MIDVNIAGAAFVDDIRDALFTWHKASKAMAIATLVNYEGRSPRPIGSQLLVTEQGDSIGLISGGCLESAIIDEARACINSGQPKLVRYGKDSDYMDIRLPCGSGIDVFIQPYPSTQWLTALQKALVERRKITWTVSLESGSVELSESTKLATVNPQFKRKQLPYSLSHFSKTFIPKVRVAAYGNGAVFEHFCILAKLFDIELIALDYSAQSTANIDLSNLLDRYSAFVCLSHEHDNEARVIAQALSTPAFYLSALGSTESHNKRIEELKALNITDDDIARVKGPAGLNLGCRTPAEIALSILAELIAQKNLCC